LSAHSREAYAVSDADLIQAVNQEKSCHDHHEPVGQLEAAREGGCVTIWQHRTETAEQAKARWQAEHPDQDLNKAGLLVLIIRWSNQEPAPQGATA